MTCQHTAADSLAVFAESACDTPGDLALADQDAALLKGYFKRLAPTTDAEMQLATLLPVARQLDGRLCPESSAVAKRIILRMGHAIYVTSTLTDRVINSISKSDNPFGLLSVLIEVDIVTP